MDPSFVICTKETLIKLLTDNADVCATSDDNLKYPTTLMQMHIDTGHHKSIASKPFWILLAKMKWLDKQIDKLLKSGIIRHSTSPWRWPVVMVSKKEDGLRLCTDFRKLSSVTTQYKFPHGIYGRNIAQPREVCIFLFTRPEMGISLDGLRWWISPYNNIHNNKMKIWIPFALVQVPARFQKMMNMNIAKITFVKLYLDDL